MGRDSLARKGGGLESHWCSHLRSSNLLPGVHELFFIPLPVCAGGNDMCIAVPAEVLEIKDGNIGVVDYGDLKQEVRLDLVDVEVGEYVLVHVGFAIQRLSREEGLKTLKVFEEVYAAMEE